MASPAGAATIAGLGGRGSVADPLVIDSPEDLDAAAAAVNGDFETFGSLSYRLDADIDYAGARFAMFAKFAGVFDGNAHEIRDITYTGTKAGIGFFQALDGATVTGLTLAEARATTTDGDGRVALVAASANNSTITGLTVLDSSAVLGTGGANNTQAAGLVASASGKSLSGATGITTISDNLVMDTQVTGRKYASGLATYLYSGTDIVIERNILVDVTVTADTGGSGSTAGLLVAQGTNTNVGGNVVVRGGVTNRAPRTIALGPASTTGRSDNFLSTATTMVTPASSAVSGYLGTPATLAPSAEPTLADLTRQSTYEGLGWDFAPGGDWRWDGSLDHPVPVRADLPGRDEISYVLGGGVDPGNQVSYTEASAPIALFAPARAHYTFAGWTGTGLSGPTMSVTVPTGSTGDRTYIATWTPLRYSVSYDLDGGTVAGSNRATYDIESDGFTLTNPVRSGYVFAGWTGTDLSDATPAVTVSAGSTGDRSYKATWTKATTYSLDYDLAGGTASGDNPVSYGYDSAPITLTNPTREGYDFAGWTGDGLTKVTIDVTIATGSAGDRSYTATWSLASYAISYDLAGGSVAGNPTTYTVETTDLTLVNPTRPSHTFAGWTGTGLSDPTMTVTIPAGSTGLRSYTATWASAPVTIEGLEGDGSTSAPLLIDSAADLDAAAAAINGDYATYGALSYGLAADIDYAGATFAGFEEFSGVFDGNGHTLSEIVYSNTDGKVALFRTLDGATVTALTLLDATAATVDGTGFAALIASHVYDSTITDNAVLDSSVTVGDGGANNTQGAGLVANSWTDPRAGGKGATIISNNLLWHVQVRANKYAGGVVGYPHFGSAAEDMTIVDNLLVDVSVIADTTGGGSTAAMVAAQQNGAMEIGGNVVIRGGTTGSGSRTQAVGFAGMSGKKPNLVSTATAIEPGSVAGDMGTPATWSPSEATTLPDLTARSTYEGLGWDFAADTASWSWDAARLHPVLSSLRIPTYALSYDLAGGHATDNPSSYGFGAEVALGTPTREGYTFSGWTGSGLSEPTAVVTIERGATGEMSFSATWTPAERPISYDLAGGTLAGGNPAVYTVESDSFTLTNPTRAGFVFIGWTGSGLDAATVTVTVPTGSAGARAYVATWSPVALTVTYNLGGGTVSGTNPTSYTIDAESFTLINPTRSGYTFGGWIGTGLTGASLSVSVDPGAGGSRSYTATWSPVRYWVVYDLDGGMIEDGSRSAYTIETPGFTLPTPTRAGHTFAGWTGTGLSTAQQDVSVPAGSTGDRSYRASWTSTRYPLTIDLAGGEASGNPSSYTFEAGFTLIDPTRNGFEFAGWTGTDLSGLAMSVTVPIGSAGPRSYVAHWTAVEETETPQVSTTVDLAIVHHPRRPNRRITAQVQVGQQAGREVATGTVVIKATTTVRASKHGRPKTKKITRKVVGTLEGGRVTVRLPRGLRAGIWTIKAVYRGNAEYEVSRSRLLKLRIE